MSTILVDIEGVSLERIWRYHISSSDREPDRRAAIPEPEGGGGDGGEDGGAIGGIASAHTELRPAVLVLGLVLQEPGAGAREAGHALLPTGCAG